MAEMTLPLCETTMTPRLLFSLIFYRVGSGCAAYPGNLGPCESFEEGMNGRCVYCGHSILCHPSTRNSEAITK